MSAARPGAADTEQRRRWAVSARNRSGSRLGARVAVGLLVGIAIPSDLINPRGGARERCESRCHNRIRSLLIRRPRPQWPGTTLEDAGRVAARAFCGVGMRATNRNSGLTYRELAQRTGWSQAAIAEVLHCPLAGADRPVRRPGCHTRRRACRTARAGRCPRPGGGTPAARQGSRSARATAPAPAVSAAGPAPTAHPAAAAVSSRNRDQPPPRQLPAGTALFTGRDREIEHLSALAGQTVTGTGAGRGRDLRDRRYGRSREDGARPPCRAPPRRALPGRAVVPRPVRIHPGKATARPGRRAGRTARRPRRATRADSGTT